MIKREIKIKMIQIMTINNKNNHKIQMMTNKKTIMLKKKIMKSKSKQKIKVKDRNKQKIRNKNQQEHLLESNWQKKINIKLEKIKMKRLNNYMIKQS